MHIGVLGGGSFGMALATHYAAQGAAVTWWMREEDGAAEITQSRRNEAFLPGVALPASVRVTTAMADVRVPEVVLLAVPAAVVVEVLQTLFSALPHPLAVVAAKGIDPDTLELLPQAIERALPNAHHTVVYLSGPSFAAEVARSSPTSVVVAGHDAALVARAQQLLSTKALRCYSSDDVIGVELGGALKNVYAIAAGIIEGVGYGLNSRAALITRAINEMTQLGWALGANPLTLAGLSGVGDLVLTCTGDLSRNRKLGLLLGRGRTLAEATSEVRMVAEGVRTAKAAAALAAKHHVDVPIATHMAKVLFEGMSVVDALRALAERDLKPEWPATLQNLARTLGR